LSEDVNSVFSPSTRELQPSALPGKWTPPDTGSDLPGLGAKHGIGNPIQVYPLYENSFRAHRHQSFADNHKESAEMYAEFAKVAEQNQYAWSHGSKAETAESIGSVTKRNRMICLPCKSMAFEYRGTANMIRSSPDERFQYDQSRRSMHIDFHRECTKSWYPIRPMDLSSRWCRYTRQ
jgi:hypothetical protein